MSRRLLSLPPLAALIAAGPPSPHATGTPAADGPGCGGGYVVARGDTLFSIARRCDSTPDAVARASGLADARIEIGQALLIPGYAAPAPPPASAPAPAPAPATFASAVYRVQAGDTLFSVARWSRTSLAALRAANPEVVPERIEIGDAINLPEGAADPAARRMRVAAAPRAAAQPRAVSRPAPPPAEEPDPIGM